MYKDVILVSDKNIKTIELNQLKEHIKIHYNVSIKELNYSENIISVSDDVDVNSLVLLYLSDFQIKVFLKNHLDISLMIGIIPTKDSLKAQKSYGI